MRELFAYLSAVGLLAAVGSAKSEETFYPSSYAARHCASCHVISMPDAERSLYPDLRGRDAPYLAEALRAYRAGERTHALMRTRAEQLSEQQLTALARYFSGINTNRQQPSHHNELGAKIAQEGLWNKGIASCNSCHGVGQHSRPFAVPTLYGQPASYLENALYAYRDGSRKSGRMERMAAYADLLSDTEISAVADYYAGDFLDDD